MTAIEIQRRLVDLKTDIGSEHPIVCQALCVLAGAVRYPEDLASLGEALADWTGSFAIPKRVSGCGGRSRKPRP